MAHITFYISGSYLSTGPIGYSGNAGRQKKCHCKRLSLYLMISSIRISFWEQKTVPVAGVVTLTVVTVTDRA